MRRASAQRTSLQAIIGKPVRNRSNTRREGHRPASGTGRQYLENRHHFDPQTGVPRQPDLPNCRRLVLPVHLLVTGLAAGLHQYGSWGRALPRLKRYPMRVVASNKKLPKIRKTCVNSRCPKGYVPSSGGISVILVDVVQAAASRMLLDGRVSVVVSSVKVR